MRDGLMKRSGTLRFVELPHTEFHGHNGQFANVTPRRVNTDHVMWLQPAVDPQLIPYVRVHLSNGEELVVQGGIDAVQKYLEDAA